MVAGVLSRAIGGWGCSSVTETCWAYSRSWIYSPVPPALPKMGWGRGREWGLKTQATLPGPSHQATEKAPSFDKGHSPLLSSPGVEVSTSTVVLNFPVPSS